MIYQFSICLLKVTSYFDSKLIIKLLDLFFLIKIWNAVLINNEEYNKMRLI